MWYEALIPLGIMTVAMTVPIIVNYTSNILMFGNPYRRDYCEEWDRDHKVRDERIVGGEHIWKTPGLEKIPDK